jgi:hypothetical protein
MTVPPDKEADAVACPLERPQVVFVEVMETRSVPPEKELELIPSMPSVTVNFDSKGGSYNPLLAKMEVKHPATKNNVAKT